MEAVSLRFEGHLKLGFSLPKAPKSEEENLTARPGVAEHARRSQLAFARRKLLVFYCNETGSMPILCSCLVRCGA